MYTPCRSAVWLRPFGGPTARPCWDFVSVIRYVRHCYAARATR